MSDKPAFTSYDLGRSINVEVFVILSPDGSYSVLGGSHMEREEARGIARSAMRPGDALHRLEKILALPSETLHQAKATKEEEAPSDPPLSIKYVLRMSRCAHCGHQYSVDTFLPGEGHYSPEAGLCYLCRSPKGRP